MRKRLTVADLRSQRGRRQLSMLLVHTIDEARAAEAAGIDILSVPIALLEAGLRDAAPTIFTVPNLEYGIHTEEEECVRLALHALRLGGDAIYCAARTHTQRRLAEEGIPVCGHAGLIPSKATWTGGFKAVGKTFASAQLVWEQIRSLEEAGCFAAELEVVPEPIATAIAEHSSLFLISMGGGSHCHAQYLFSDDVLGSNPGHIPSHAKIYADFSAKYAALQTDRIEAYRAYADDVTSGVYPDAQHKVSVDPVICEQFRNWLSQNEQHARLGLGSRG